MSSSQDFLQDYVEEVQEHLQELSQSLLVLEQEGADPEQIAQAFRAAHSIKGASAYMGFEGLATLTHELESLMGEFQVNLRSVPSSCISLLLECVDLMTAAMEFVKANGTEPPLDLSFLENLRKTFSEEGKSSASPAPKKEEARETQPEAEPEPLQEEDEELLGIFISAFRENYSELLQVLRASNDSSLSEKDLGTARELLDKLTASAQYMDYQQIVAVLEQWSKEFPAEESVGVGRQKLLNLLESSAVQLERIVPGLKIASNSGPESIEPEMLIDEEDEELFSIFLETFQQNFSELAERIALPQPGEKDLESAAELTGRLMQSSHYMDYEQIVGLLEEWQENLLLFKGQPGKDSYKLRGAFEALSRGLQKVLAGFKLPDLSAKEHAGSGFAGDGEDEIEIDFDFGSEEDFASAEPSGLVSSGPAEGVKADTGEKKRETGLTVSAGQKKQEGLVRTSPGEPAAQASGKERTVLVAEDVAQHAATATLRVDAQKVDQLLNQVGELVVTRSEFIQTTTLFRDILRDLSSRGVLSKAELRRLKLLGFRLNESTQSLGRVANDLQSSVMRVRMLPIFNLFQRFPRVIRDQALKLGKKVQLVIEGGETEIDKRVLEQMSDPLVQFLRNALVHGIESPEQRIAAGKPETGIIRLAAYHAGDYVAIEVEDDGRGIDTGKLRQLLEERKEISRHELEGLSDQEIAYSIFLPRISTYERVDGSAGRGVGLDVVKENVEHMNGSIEVEFVPGQGTRFMIKIPLTVAIIRALLVREAEQIFTLPLTSVAEILRYDPATTHTIEGFRVITLRGKTIPLVSLRELLNLESAQQEGSGKFIVIVSTSFREVGLIVDGLVGEREVVIKSIEAGFQYYEGFSGATILGDGRVSLIVDVSGLLRMVKNTPATGQLEEKTQYLH